MRLITDGATRDVLLIGRWAIKVPTLRHGLWSFCRGVLANQSEMEWTKAEAPHIAPVKWSFLGLVSVYPRCEPLPKKFKKKNVGEPLVGELPDRRRCNLGMLDGEPVWLDYDMSWAGYYPKGEEPKVRGKK